NFPLNFVEEILFPVRSASVGRLLELIEQILQGCVIIFQENCYLHSFSPPQSGFVLHDKCQRLQLRNASPLFVGHAAEVIHFPFSLLAAISVPFLQFANELFRITLNLVNVVVGELAPPLTDVSLYLKPFTFENVCVHSAPLRNRSCTCHANCRSTRDGTSVLR